MSARAEAWPRVRDEEAQMLTEDVAKDRDVTFAGLGARRSRLFRVAYALLRNAHDAEDAVQEAFLKLYRGEAWRRSAPVPIYGVEPEFPRRRERQKPWAMC